MNVFFIIGIFEAFFLSILLYAKKGRTKSDIALASYFLLFGISILSVYIENYNIEQNLSLLSFTFISPPLLLLHGPFLWFYAKTLTSINFRITWKVLIHLIPFVIFTPQILMVLNNLPPESRLEIIKNETFKDWFIYKFYVILITIDIFSYLIFVKLHLYRHYNKTSKFILTKPINFVWINIFLGLTVILYGLTLPINVIDIFYPFVSFKEYQFTSYLFGSIFIPIAGFLVHIKSDSFSTQTNSFVQNINANNYSFDNSIGNDKKALLDILVSYFEKEKPYIQQDLNLKKLAKHLSVSPDYLSEIINNKLKVSFIDFVNTYRVEEFKEKLKNRKNRDKTIIEIAFESGFNSKATFNRVFRNKANMTPTEYKNSVSKN
jgi:AraC-like DNA-binding protein